MEAEKRWSRAQPLLPETVISVRKGKGTAVLDYFMRRIYNCDGTVNSVVESCAPSTTISAREASSHPRPLEGLPFLVKDSLDVKDFHSVCGSSLYVTRPVARHDCSIVATLRELGAVPVGKTNLPKLGLDVQTFNGVYGTTSNPYNVELTSGGSSGGSAAAVALGLAAFSVGTDWNGSLRIPAAFCGVCSLRASRGRMTLDGRDHTLPPMAKDPELLGHILVQGLFTRGVADLRFCMGKLLQKSLASQSSFHVRCEAGKDSSSQGEEIQDQALREKQSTRLDPIFTSVGVAVPFSGLPLGRRIEDAMRKIPLWVGDSDQDVGAPKLEAVMTDKFSLDLYQIRKAMQVFSVGLVSTGEETCHADFVAKLEWAKGVQARSSDAVDGFLENHGFSALIIPVCPVLPPEHNYEHAPVEINGVKVPYFRAMCCYVEPISVSGNPVVTMPLCWIEGKPCGIQVIGKMGDDERLLHVCEQLERLLHVANQSS
ncbi:unnamed protein product [Calypogeia fissa]